MRVRNWMGTGLLFGSILVLGTGTLAVEWDDVKGGAEPIPWCHYDWDHAPVVEADAADEPGAGNDCGFIKNSDLRYFCKRDCGFIRNSDLRYMCKGDCGFIRDSDQRYYCKRDCSFIRHRDLRYYCKGDCGFIKDSDLRYYCKKSCGFIKNADLRYLCRSNRPYPGKR